MTKKNDIVQRIKSSFTIFEIIVAVAAVVVALLNVWTASKLAPIAERISVVETEIRANETKDEVDHANFVSKDTFNTVVTRLNYISNRVDAIYGILIK